MKTRFLLRLLLIISIILSLTCCNLSPKTAVFPDSISDIQTQDAPLILEREFTPSKITYANLYGKEIDEILVAPPVRAFEAFLLQTTATSEKKLKCDSVVRAVLEKISYWERWDGSVVAKMNFKDANALYGHPVEKQLTVVLSDTEIKMLTENAVCVDQTYENLSIGQEYVLFLNRWQKNAFNRETYYRQAFKLIVPLDKPLEGRIDGFPLSNHFGAVFGEEQNARQKSDELLQNSKNFLSYLNQLMQEVQVPEKEPSFFPYVDSSELTELVRQSDVIIHARLLPESDAQKVKVAYNRLNYSFEILHCYRGHELLKTSEQGQKIAVYPGDAQPNKEYIFLLSFSGNYDSVIYQNSINSIQPLTKKKEIARIIAQQAAEKAETS